MKQNCNDIDFIIHLFIERKSISSEDDLSNDNISIEMENCLKIQI